jgi:hypothetical protein
MNLQVLGDKIKKQSITMSTIVGKAIEAVVAYITIWFFKPLWEKFIKWSKRKNNE